MNAMNGATPYYLIAVAIGLGIGVVCMCVGLNLWPALAVVFVAAVAQDVALNTYLPMRHERQMMRKALKELTHNKDD